MTKLFKSTALALAASTAALTAIPAEAQSRYDRDRYEQRYDRYDRGYDRRDDRRYDDRRYDDRRYDERVTRNTRVWHGNNGQTYCRKQDGTTGLIIGGAVGALLGREIDSRGDRTLGTVLGAAAGALLGNQVAGGTRCR
ncbi:MAG: hypothetical protein B7Z08_11895 [Sphingomonadales bacterium 32-68-7]|nr:MAG: hypothetical protein B7Z33_12605 [Sphingomonadales bacterium 12-68-11]OYX07696.1 MAG: hypothetical protein B7Z08_11895 [Sphingomonadales bacterium 32-68-7]